MTANQPPREGQFLLYQTEDHKLKIEVRFQDDTVWLSLNQLVELFQRDKSVISRHIKNVFVEGELSPEGTVAKSATVQTLRMARNYWNKLLASLNPKAPESVTKCHHPAGCHP